MRILGVDTATSTASVALIDNGQLVAEQTSLLQYPVGKGASPSARTNHAEIILPLIESLLKQAQCDLQQMSGLALSIGPGSFTGLRIGLSTIKGLAYGCSIPVVGVSTLLANAARVTNYEGLICSFLNARKNEVYGSLFRKNGDVLDRITEDLVAPAKTILEIVRSIDGAEPCMFLGDGAMAYGDLIAQSMGARASPCSGEFYPSVASAVARLSAGRFRCNDVDSIGALAPTYLRAPAYEFKAQSETQLVEIPSLTLR